MPRQQQNNYSELSAQWVHEASRVEAMQFGLLDPDTITRMSVAEIKSTQIYDQETFLPNFHALNDPRLGVVDKESRCYTCKADMNSCSGHFGHISLNAPVYHAGMLNYILKVLKCVCFNCSQLLACKKMSSSEQTDLEQMQEREKISKIKNKKIRFKRMQILASGVLKCETDQGGCGYKQPKLRKNGLKIEIEFRDENFDTTKDRKDTLWPDQALRVLERITNEDCDLMGLDPVNGRPEWTILRNIAVAPPAVRPSVIMTSTMRSEDDLTYAYQQILKMNIVLKEQKEKGANQTIINEIRTTLQYYVATLMDNKIAGQPVQKHKSGKAIKCIRSRLKGKEGRLRGNLMGKRVDFSARTVITPDPNLDLDELGVPVEVAKNMTFPETVTAQNIDILKLLVQNGPEEWPGAKYIIRHDERQIDLSMLRNRSDVHLEIGYKVERHLKDGDYVIFNRQPSLHKMSIMGHRVKVLPYSTFRLNLSVTTPYNADFDGDEMNMHVAQSFESQAEIREIMSVPKQIISPQSNRPVMGIVQDSLLGAMIMTQRDTFIDKEDAMQLCMWVTEFGHSGEVKSLPLPAILKPKPLWTGKQIFSLLIPNINLSLCRSPEQQFISPKDSNVLIERGEILMGFLTKQMIGCTGQALAHVITKEYGHEKCAQFLSSVQKLVNNWLISTGFTVGVQDIIVNQKKTASSIKNTLESYKNQVQSIVTRSQLGKLKSQPGKTMKESFEAKVNKKLNDARDQSGNIALDGLSQENRLRNMVQAGSKGSNINISQIMACVGQQNVEGKRIPFGFNHRTLPHFSKDDFGPESKGFVESSYLSGLSASELYFHAMGGREGLIDTAVKTAETGYISRRLIKALEDVMVQYDGSVRSSKHEIIQFIYGEDGIAGENIEDLTIESIRQNDKDIKNDCQFPLKGQDEKRDIMIRQSVTDSVFSDLSLDKTQQESICKEFEQILQDRQTLRYEFFKHSTDDQVHLPVNVSRIIANAKSQFGIKCNSKSDLRPDKVVKKLNAMLNELSVLPGSKTMANRFVEDADVNARMLLNIYMRYNLCSNKVILKERLNSTSFDWVLGEIRSRFESSIVDPGEMVGSVAAQSMGEPATQMTLNTFHFAGISAKNVTLGVPRFKEIINVSNNIKTPSLKIFMSESCKKKQSKVSKLGMLIEYTTLCHVVSQSSIYYDPDPERTVIPEDVPLVQLYNDVPIEDDAQKGTQSPWLLRFELDKDKMVHKGVQMQLIDRKLSEVFADQVSLMISDENSDTQVVRIRINNIDDDPTETVAMYLRNEFEPLLLNQLALKGLPEIQKVTYTKHQEHHYCKKTGKLEFTDDNWVIETDGTALQKVLSLEKVDSTKTISNDNIEVLKVLGCEASRQSLINELRFVFSSYGIYVNYRHISTLVDVMTQRGKLTSITRHGINRVDSSGPLRKCSFEETVEILLEGAMFSEMDRLSGISENVIMGQLGPFGSGCFGIQLDADVVERFATQANGFDAIFERESFGKDTPLIEEEDINKLMTPMIGMTPAFEENMIGSTHISNAQSAMMTPGGYKSEIQFSPNPMSDVGQFVSPNYQSPSPYYQSPLQSGIRVASGQYASPIYNQISTLNSGSAVFPNSPIYQSSNPSGNKQEMRSGQYVSPIYQQQQQNAAMNCYSPAYGQNLNVTSPAYTGLGINQGQSVGRSNHISPMYSPTAAYIKSPVYTSLNNASKSIGEQKQMSGYSPQYTPPLQSPTASAAAYNPLSSSSVNGSQQKSVVNGMPIQSPIYVPHSLDNHQHNASADAATAKLIPQYHQTTAQVVQSPVYNPASPQYQQQLSHKKEQVMAQKRNAPTMIKEESDESD